MLDTDVTVDDKTQLFSTCRKHNNSETVTSDDKNTFGQVILGSYITKCKQYTTANMKHQKLTPYGNGYLCFQTDGKNARAANYSKSRVLKFFVKNNIYIGSFGNKCVIIKGLSQ